MIYRKFSGNILHSEWWNNFKSFCTIIAPPQWAAPPKIILFQKNNNYIFEKKFFLMKYELRGHAMFSFSIFWIILEKNKFNHFFDMTNPLSHDILFGFWPRPPAAAGPEVPNLRHWLSHPFWISTNLHETLTKYLHKSGNNCYEIGYKYCKTCL